MSRGQGWGSNAARDLHFFRLGQPALNAHASTTGIANSLLQKCGNFYSLHPGASIQVPNLLAWSNYLSSGRKNVVVFPKLQDGSSEELLSGGFSWWLLAEDEEG